MKRPASLLAFLLTFAADDLRAQITITADDMRAQYRAGISWNSTYYAATNMAAQTAAVQALANATGPNARYDFTPFQYRVFARDTFATAATTAGTWAEKVSAWSGAGPVVVRRKQVNVHDLTDQGLYFRGLIYARDLNGDQKVDTAVVTFSPTLLMQPLPTTASSAWEVSYERRETLNGVAQEPIWYHVSSRVEGYGTLVTPAGNVEVLRVRTREYQRMVSSIDLTGDYTEFYSKSMRIYAYFERSPTSGQVSAVTYAPFSVPTTAETAAGSPVATLAAPAPNPFLSTTSLPFSIAQPGHVRLSVFDVVGREVAVLVDDERAAGRYEARLDGVPLPPGTYVVRLVLGGKTSSAQVITRGR